MHIQVRDDTSCQVLRSHSRSCPKYCSSPWKLLYLCSPRNHHPSNYIWLVGSTVIKSSAEQNWGILDVWPHQIIYFCNLKKKSNVVGCQVIYESNNLMLKVICVIWPHILSNILIHLPTGKPPFKSTGTKLPKLQATCSLKWRGTHDSWLKSGSTLTIFI